MDEQDILLNSKDERVLRFLQKCEGQRFSIEQLAEGTGLPLDMAEKALSSLEKRGLVKVTVMVNDPFRDREGAGTEKASLESSLSSIEELLGRLSKLAAKKEVTKAAVYDRVRERLNDELSKAIAKFEFAVDRTHEQLSQLTNEINSLRDQIDEIGLTVEIGEISEGDGERRTQECHNKIAQLDVQRREIIEAESRIQQQHASRQKLREKEAQRLRGLLEELEVRKQVGEFEGKEQEFQARRDEILANLASATGQDQASDGLVRRAEDLVRTGRALVDKEAVLKPAFSRLSRACERIAEMSLSAKPDQAK